MRRGERAKESKRGGSAGAREGGLRGRRLWITAPRGAPRGGNVSDSPPMRLAVEDRGSSSASAFRWGIGERKYRVPERQCARAARCVSDVICGCHGDAIDWPTRRQTSRESRRHSDYCPPPAPLPRTDCHPLPPSVPPSHDAASVHVRSRRRARARENPHDCGLSRVCTNTRAYTGTSAHTRSPNCPLYPI